MISPPIGSHVKVLLRNATTVEGIVETWNDQNIKLISLDQKSYCILYEPKQDILLVKVFIEPVKEIETTPIPEKKKIELEQQFQKTYQEPSEDPLRVKKIAELKIMMAAQERQITANKLKQHHIPTVVPVNYEQPNFFKK